MIRTGNRFNWLLNDVSKEQSKQSNTFGPQVTNTEVLGFDNTIQNGNSGVVCGTDNDVRLSNSIVSGTGNTVSAVDSMVIGSGNQVNGSNILLIGNNMTGNTDNSIYLGDANTSIYLNGNTGSTLFNLWTIGNSGGTSVKIINDSTATAASGDNALSMGYGTNASGYLSTAFGYLSQSSGSYSTSFGSITIASGIGSIAAGQVTNATGAYSIATGRYATANHYCEMARASTSIGQYGTLTYGQQTGNATPTEIYLDGSSERFSIASGTTYWIEVTAIALSTATGDSKQWTGNILIKNVSGTTSAVGTTAMSSVHGNASLAASSIAITADNTNDGLKVEVTGVAATTINWFVKAKYVKV